jgi:glycosyltransferase involved in cell wall biosynthesis
LLQERGILSVVDLLIWDEPGPLASSLKDVGIECRLIPIEGSSQDRIRKLIASFKRSQSDIYVANLVTPALLAASYIRQSGTPTVGVLHSDDDFYQGVIDVFLRGRRQDALSAAVTVSNCLSEKALEASLHGTLIKQIPCGVPVPDASTLVGAKEDLSLLYAGRLEQKQKRIIDLTNVLLQCVDRFPNCNATIIGDGAERKNVENLLQSHTAGHRIRLTGRVLPAAVQEIMKEHDIFLLLSDFEGLPVALLEAMACGLVPIVHKMRSGIPELIQHEVNGLVVEDRSKSVLDAVARLRKDRILLRRLSQRARETVVQKYSNVLCADDWAYLLHHLHASKISRRQIHLPKSLNLPRVHPALAAEDPRAEEPTLLSRFFSKMTQYTKTLRANCLAL